MSKQHCKENDKPLASPEDEFDQREYILKYRNIQHLFLEFLPPSSSGDTGTRNIPNLLMPSLLIVDAFFTSLETVVTQIFKTIA